MSEHDPVNSPSHYTQGRIEPIEAIEDWKLGFNLGNAVKYIARAGKKDPSKMVEDLKKCRYYLNREITSFSISEEDEDGAETILEAVDRLRGETGFSRNEVMSTAVWLYSEAIQAKRAGKHVGVVDNHGNIVAEWGGLFEGDDSAEETSGEPLPDDFEPNEETLQAIKDVDAGVGVERYADAAEMLDAVSTEPEPFKVGDHVQFQIDDQPSPATGVVKRVLYGKPVYLVDWKESDGAEWESEHWLHELKPANPVSVKDEAKPESKTVVCYRCDGCGMPIAPGYGIKERDTNGAVATYHLDCFPNKANAKPKFAVGDKVVLANLDTACVGVVQRVQINDNTETAYEIAWTAQAEDARFESELKPFESEPKQPKFKPGDRVRHKWSTQNAVVFQVDDDALFVYWTESGKIATLAVADAVHVED